MKTSPPSPSPARRGEFFPPSLAGKGVRGLGLLTHNFSLDTPVVTS